MGASIFEGTIIGSEVGLSESIAEDEEGVRTCIFGNLYVNQQGPLNAYFTFRNASCLSL